MGLVLDAIGTSVLQPTERGGAACDVASVCDGLCVTRVEHNVHWLRTLLTAWSVVCLVCTWHQILQLEAPPAGCQCLPAAVPDGFVISLTPVPVFESAHDGVSRDHRCCCKHCVAWSLLTHCWLTHCMLRLRPALSDAAPEETTPARLGRGL